MSATLDMTGFGGPLTEELAERLKASAALSARTGRPDDDMILEVRKSGLLSLAVPVEYGGAGGDAAALNEMVERVAMVNPSVSIILFQHYAVSARVSEWGTAAQKSKLLPALAAGDLLAASAWSEPGAGAAKKQISSTAVPLPGDRWLLNGAKSFTTSAGIADIYLVLVQTSAADEASDSSYGASGQSFFLVSGDNPGLEPDLRLDLVGMRGSATGFVSLKDCEVSDDDRLGPLGKAPAIIAGVRETGATLGAVAVGIARTFVDIARAHAARGRSLLAEVRLVEMSTLVEAAKGMVERAGSRASDNPGITTLHSKLFASTTAEQVGSDVSRMLGSSGYVLDNRLNMLLADVRAVALMGPTNDLCRELVVASWAA